MKPEFLILLFLAGIACCGLALLSVQFWQDRKDRAERKAKRDEIMMALAATVSSLVSFFAGKDVERSQRARSEQEEQEATQEEKNKQAEESLIERLANEMIGTEFIRAGGKYLHVSKICDVSPAYCKETGRLEKVDVATEDGAYYVSHGAARVFLRWWEMVVSSSVTLRLEPAWQSMIGIINNVSDPSSTNAKACEPVPSDLEPESKQ